MSSHANYTVDRTHEWGKKQLSDWCCAIDFWTANNSYLHSKTYGHRVCYICYIVRFDVKFQWDFRADEHCQFSWVSAFWLDPKKPTKFKCCDFEQFIVICHFFARRVSSTLKFGSVCKLRWETAWKYIATVLDKTKIKCAYIQSATLWEFNHVSSCASYMAYIHLNGNRKHQKNTFNLSSIDF